MRSRSCLSRAAPQQLLYYQVKTTTPNASISQALLQTLPRSTTSASKRLLKGLGRAKGGTERIGYNQDHAAARLLRSAAGLPEASFQDIEKEERLRSERQRDLAEAAGFAYAVAILKLEASVVDPTSAGTGDRAGAAGKH